MLSNRIKCVAATRQRKCHQRWELVPLFGWIAKEPFDRTCLVIKGNNKILAAGYQKGVIRWPVGNGVVMKPIIWGCFNELACIIASGRHGCSNDVSKIPSL